METQIVNERPTNSRKKVTECSERKRTRRKTMQQFKSQAEVDEFVNQMRAERDLGPLPDSYHVTQIVEGMYAGCGCQVASVRPGSHYTIYHHNDCRIVNPHLHRRDVVYCTPEGQAVCSTLDPYTKAVMRLNLPWPHEL